VIPVSGSYPGFHIASQVVGGQTNIGRLFVPSMRHGWQFPSGWGDTLASRNTGRVYLTAPKPLHGTSIYNDALCDVRARHRECIVI
jgi:hypothetical protein